MSTRQYTGGQIHPHQCNADFDGELLGDNITLEESHIEEVQAVEQFSLNAETRKKHQNRIKHIYNYWERSFPDYFRVGVRGLSGDDLNDNTKYTGRTPRTLCTKASIASF